MQTRTSKFDVQPRPRFRSTLFRAVLGLMPLLGIGTLLAGDPARLSAAEPPVERFEFSQTHMGMTWKLIFYASDEKSANLAAERTFQRIAELDRTLSDYLDDSELTRLSATAGSGEFRPVGDDLWTVLEAGQRLAGQSDGAFDVTIGPLTRLWRRTRRQRELPTADRLTMARTVSGHTLLQLDAERRTARLEQPGMRLDLGGIAAGFAADEALRVLQQAGVDRALIDASGDVVVGEAPPGRPGWTIGIDLPIGPDRFERQYVDLRRAALTTSGDLYQFVELNGVRYSHLVDPRTGLGLTNRATATIIAPRGIDADSLATAVCIAGWERGRALLAAARAEGVCSWIEGGEWRRSATPGWPGVQRKEP